MLPPSPHLSGVAYRWARSPFEHEIADAPDWIVDRLRDRRREKIASDADDDYLIPGGQRYDHMIRFAGLVRSCGVNETTHVECGLAFLRHQCRPDPPMDFEYAEAQLRKVWREWDGSYTPPEDR